MDFLQALQIRHSRCNFPRAQETMLPVMTLLHAWHHHAAMVPWQRQIFGNWNGQLLASTWKMTWFSNLEVSTSCGWCLHVLWQSAERVSKPPGIQDDHHTIAFHDICDMSKSIRRQRNSDIMQKFYHVLSNMRLEVSPPTSCLNKLYPAAALQVSPNFS